MPTPTYSPIVTQTLSSDTTSITFSSIPSTYVDLVLVMSAQSTRTDYDSPAWLQFNSDTGTNYSYTYIYSGSVGTIGVGGSRVANDTGITVGYIAAASGSSQFSPVITNIQSYGNASIYKGCISRGNEAITSGTFYGVSAFAGLWRNTAAINTIKINTITGFKSGSSFTLYGIKGA